MADTTSCDNGIFERHLKKSDEFDKGNVVGVYKQWALDGKYDMDLAKSGGPKMAADELDNIFTNGKDQIRIVDIGAGTGNVAVELRRRGYTRMDSIEPVPEMTDVARKKNIYENYICEFLSEKPFNISEGTYDVAFCVGILAGNHFPPASMKEILRIVKAGGYIIIVGSCYHYYRLPEFHRDLAQEMYRLETENKMRIMKREIKEGYLILDNPSFKDAIVFVIRKS